jgi:C1A family cysteine protease
MKRVYNLCVKRIPSDRLNYITLSPKIALPDVVDLRNKMPPIYDQGQLGSCTANALAAAFDYERKKSTSVETWLNPSRLFIYYNERKIEHDIPDDAGAQISDGVLALEKYGCCAESLWDYNIRLFAEKPPDSAYKAASLHRVLKAQHVKQDILSMRTALAAAYPFVVGISVYDSFETDAVAASGRVPMPNKKKESLLGGHAVVCVGYDNPSERWIMRNSWGTMWGVDGYFTLPYEYLVDQSLCSDLWKICVEQNLPDDKKNALIK